MSYILRSSKKALVGLGLAGCGAAAAVILGYADNNQFRVSAADLPQSLAAKLAPFATNIPPKRDSTWDSNWDKREPEYLVKPLKGRFSSLVPSANDENSINERIEKAKAVATRHLILVRHGQYNLDGKTDIERTLTDLGREQARLTGLRLKELSLPYTRLVQSTMTRATETASIISRQLASVIEMKSCDFLREGAPIPPDPPVGHWRPEAKQFYEDGARIEAAFRRYFHRADPDQKKDSYEVIVCHANVIRYFICRALQFPPEAWLRFSLHNCSLTWIAIRPSGRVSVYAIGDIGHMPPSKMTTT